ncbi:hypothetical protein DFH08DRAFT_973686 [Mycena albidolilacea]|uniref:Uncharacterized protein n=1 Tax=Mycena albidolilacea TaxID=1033008 RepID=A0AAD6Z990_9AGAR|nr:hypothetical protein DFH08DRAFT_973686 [Mycena albidolilacea]
MCCAWKAPTNILTFDPLHSKLLAHSGLLISSPDLLCGPEERWEHPEVIYAILAMECRLPHLRGALVAFLDDALETWIRFTAEFTSKGRIASLSAGEQDSAAMLSTNDMNEGTLGADACVAKCRAPRAGLEFINRKLMYKRNNTQAYAAQNLQSRYSGASAADVRTVIEHRVGKDKRNKKRAKEQAEIDKCPVIFDAERFREEESLRVAKVVDMDLQLKWYRS